MSGKDDSNGKTHGPRASGGPQGRIADSLSKPLSRRFYTDVSIKDGAFYQILLDGRPVKTPGKRALMLPTGALAAAVAGEWLAQERSINPASMPLTRFANTAIDAVADALEEVAADIVAYSGRDLVCYRAEAPDDLVLRQTTAWDPIVAWAEAALGVKFTVVKGVMPVDQPQRNMNAIAAALEPHDAFRLTALHVMTTLTGSALLTLAHARGFRTAEETWAAAHVDEDYQILLWGEEREAAERRKERLAEFGAASRMLAALKG